MGQFKNVLLDLDGTLTDPFEGISNCIRHAVENLGMKPPAQDDLRSAVGPPLRQTFGRFLATNNSVLIDEAMRLYRERFVASGIYENRVYCGVPEMLTLLSASGCSLFIATSKPRIFAQRIIDHFALTEHFVGIYGSDLDGAYEDKCDLLHFLLHTEGLNANSSAMVGDRRHDMISAKKHGLCAVGAAWGYGSSRELTESGADVVCNDPEDVVRFIKQSDALLA